MTSSATIKADNVTGRQRGFTLVELAIVMILIGLVVGGFFKGAELIDSARVSATISQVESIDAATNTFRATFGDLPGDVALANVRLPRCGTECNPATAGSAAGNRRIGRTTWSSAYPSQFTQLLSTNADETAETMLFWMHLDRTDLIFNVGPRTNVAVGQWGVTNPAARAGGGFVVGYAHSGGSLAPGAPAGSTPPLGHYLALVNTPESVLGVVAGMQPLTARRAAAIDRKADDGSPSAGYILAYGTQATCFTDAATRAYNEQLPLRDCGLMFRFAD